MEMRQQNISAQNKQVMYKTIFVSRDGDARKESVIRTGTHAECAAALENAEKEAQAGKGQYDLRKGHFALLADTADAQEPAPQTVKKQRTEKQENE